MTNKKKNRLQDAIENLPMLQAPDKIWLAISERLDSQEESGHDNLNKAKEQLQSSTLEAPDIWDEIAGHMSEEASNSEDVLKRAILELPVAELPADVFDQVVADVAEKGSERWFKQPRMKWAAAIIAFLLISWFAVNINTNNEAKITETIAYSEESISTEDDIQEILSSFEHNDEVMALVESTCLPLEIKCENPEFKGLLTQYQELEDVKDNLIEEIKVHQGQSQLVDYLVRVEKEKTEIGKKLINYLLS